MGWRIAAHPHFPAPLPSFLRRQQAMEIQVVLSNNKYIETT
jgi:hypothetical protein